MVSKTLVTALLTPVIENSEVLVALAAVVHLDIIWLAICVEPAVVSTT